MSCRWWPRPHSSPAWWSRGRHRRRRPRPAGPDRTGYTVSVCLDPALDGTTLTGSRAGHRGRDRDATRRGPGRPGRLLLERRPRPLCSPTTTPTRHRHVPDDAAQRTAGRTARHAVRPRLRPDDPDGTAPPGTTSSSRGAARSATLSPVPPAPFVPRTAAPGPDGRVRLAVVGDGVDGSPESLAVAAQVAALDPDVFAYLGDVYDNGTPFEFDTWYGDPAGYGRFRGITNPAIGNHEYRTDDAAPYFAYWGGVPHYYSYDVGGWHLVVLDSTTDFAAATGIGASWRPVRRSTTGWPRTWPPTRAAARSRTCTTRATATS